MIALTTDKLQNAIARAKQLRPTVRFLGERHFVVCSSRNRNEYEVRFAVVNGVKQGQCSCRAGQEGMPCYHLAAAASVNIGVAAMRQRAALPTPPRSSAHIYATWQDTPFNLPQHQHTCPDCHTSEICTDDCEARGSSYQPALCVACLDRREMAA